MGEYTRTFLRQVRAQQRYFCVRMRLEYPAKILLAWAEAIGGDVKLRDWLLKNGYEELAIFCSALRNKQEARIWLMKNGHPHLMAVINGIEGQANALEWLERNGMGVLKQVALAGDGDEQALKWLIQNKHLELARAAHKMGVVKRGIDDDHADPHKYWHD